MVRRIELSGIPIDVLRKRIKNLHLSVHPPTGRVRISAPLWLSEEAIRVFAISKVGWIKKHQLRILQQERESPRELLDRESHYLWGERHLLKVVDSGRRSSTEKKHRTIELHVHPALSRSQRETVLENWYRNELKSEIPALIQKWEPIVGVKIGAWGVKKMKTRWGSCNVRTKRIWLNLELVKKPPECLEYVLVHELVHLLEKKHGDRFKTLMDQFLPQWKHVKNRLNRFPLSHQEWEY